MPLYDILNEFQKGHSHMAIVVKQCNKMNEKPADADKPDKPDDGMYLFVIVIHKLACFWIPDSGLDGITLIKILSQTRFPERC